MTKVIHNPALANIDEHSATSATFSIEPLHAGYGNTLGNSLRRVLLSSILGGAIVAFRIEGVSHEFTTVPGVKEDVVDIMLNLKQVCLNVHSDMIALDAVFSPVLRVRFKVDSTRVGQETNLDKLLITVETDGSITPREAFEEAAAILVNQYTALAGSTTVEAAPALGQDSDEESSELNTPVEELNLSARTANALINNDIRTVHDLVTLSEQDLRELKGFGSKALDEVKDKLAELEL